MSSAVCTLFEGHYHYGVSALVNSLYKQGYKGDFYVGYRGQLPKWVNNYNDVRNISNFFEWQNVTSVEVTSDLRIYFLPLTTDYHLTNYKPDFMLRLLQGPAKSADGLFYFDPDIVISGPWYYFLEWIQCGVALCEDVNSPISEYHPRRVAWRRLFSQYKIELKFKTSIYVNGGFIGVSKADFHFLENWKSIQEHMSLYIGGLDKSIFKNGGQLAKEAQGDFAPFSKTDQDALNITTEVWNRPISYIGQEAMAFKHGAAILPHALGTQKPWVSSPIVRALKGQRLRVVDRLFWENLSGPIRPYKLGLIKFRQFELKIAAFVGRFYGNS
ncbi:hypothetical protein MUY27_10995 [Mucilaginibacter sp. RS28]|uniref:Uncharacterized protein n=1 Tax=Mucilaginibacter straminoryzae TaxID=2932774 RepID=A0A9X2B947_9SPHI|nr:hypothetical protein [Mucilaginibacter straminoryzae]MCJ8210239.1 hypothetical protein [Mucilaginibacter straminoryzae]